MPHYTYIVECSNGSLYTGYTDDVDARIRKHNSGKGAAYTRSFGPVSLAACWAFETKTDAMRFEWQIKQLSRASKLKLIADTAHIRMPLGSQSFQPTAVVTQVPR
jgi:putative endonuclease